MPELEPTHPAKARGRSSKLFLLIAVALALLYAASPYYAVWRFREAIRAHDMKALAGQVDFNAVRGSLKQQIRDKFLGALNDKQRERLTQFLRTSENDPLDQLLDAYLTPEGLAALIGNPGPIKNATSIPSLPSLNNANEPIDWSKFRNAFFTRPREFAVDHEQIRLRFRFKGLAWKLHAIDLGLAPPQK
jgi:hypothetical protein